MLRNLHEVSTRTNLRRKGKDPVMAYIWTIVDMNVDDSNCCNTAENGEGDLEAMELSLIHI